MRWKPIFRRKTNSMRCRKQTRSPACSAFLTVQEGCDKFCTFCVVPYTRGSEYLAARRADRSRSAAARRPRRARDHAARPERQCLSRRRAGRRAPGSGAADRNTRRASKGLTRLRYTTSHPRDMGDDLIAAHGDIEELMPYLHLPVQSGSDAMLEAMNRQHTARRLSAHRGSHPRRAAGHRAVVRFHRRLPRRERQGFRSHDGAGPRQSVTRRPSRSNTARVPARRRRRAQSRLPEDVKDARLQALQALLREQQDGVQRILRGPHACPCCSKSRAANRGRRSAAVPICSPCMSMVPTDLIGKIAEVRIEA